MSISGLERRLNTLSKYYTYRRIKFSLGITDTLNSPGNVPWIQNDLNPPNSARFESQINKILRANLIKSCNVYVKGSYLENYKLQHMIKFWL